MGRFVDRVNRKFPGLLLVLALTESVGCKSKDSSSAHDSQDMLEDASTADSGGGDAGEEQCLINSAPLASLSNVNDYCIHMGPEEHTCCSLVAAKLNVAQGCGEHREILNCYIAGPVGDSLSCAWGQIATCFKKTLADGGVEIWATSQVYGFPGQEDLIGENFHDSECQAYLNLPACSGTQ